MSLELVPSVNQIFEKVKALTGKDIQLIEKADLATYAGIKFARKNMPSHLLFYKTEHSELIDHLVAHECGHILRIFGVPQDKRLIPYSNDQIKSKGLTSIENEIQKLSQTLSFPRLAQIINMWYAGLFKQLTSYPSDIRIEQWLYDEYPELRTVQSQSLKKQFEEALAGLSAKAESITPRTILDASNTLNYAFFRYVGTQFNDSSFFRRYDRSGHASVGNQLLLLHKDSVDSYAGDIDVVNKWAEVLQLSDWFGWIDFEEVPDNYSTTMS
jgi:hypothetical protein